MVRFHLLFLPPDCHAARCEAGRLHHVLASAAHLFPVFFIIVTVRPLGLGIFFFSGFFHVFPVTRRRTGLARCAVFAAGEKTWLQVLSARLPLPPSVWPAAPPLSPFVR